MCRITGIIDFKKNRAANNENIINAMRDSMTYGGPDDCGSYLYEQQNFKIALGHRRLSIIDLSVNGHQPMKSADENVVIIFNGEIYNYEEIRNELLNTGISFKTHSDTEVIIEAYNKWGIDCIHRFIGMFAFLLLDKRENCLYAVRDRAGVKPLYYYNNDELILFGSELKSFHRHPDFKRSLDNNALALYLQFGYIPAPHCIFQNTFKILPGHYLKINLLNGDIDDTQYWSATDKYKQPPLTDLSVPEIIKETERLLVSACNYRMIADVPVGVFLSGGYDSSLITALLQKDRTKKIKTFSIGFNEEKFNEAHYAKKVAHHLGTDHTEYYCTQTDALNIIPLLPEIYDEPFGDSSAIPTTLVSQLARQSVKVALSADGGDEVFGGYEKYSRIVKLKKLLRPLPAPLQKVSGTLLESLNPESLFAGDAKNNLNKKISKFSRMLQSGNMADTLYWYSINFTQKQLETILKRPFKKIKTNFDQGTDFKMNDDINAMLAIDYITYLPDDILTKVDRATMSVSLEGREPLLDHHLLEWMAQVPGTAKINKGIKKYILKEIVHKHIPKEVMDRPKMGFGVPIETWFKTDLKEYFETYLGVKSLEKHNLFDIEYIQKLKAWYYTGKAEKNVVSQLWYLLMFQMWYEKWMIKQAGNF